MIEPFVAYGVEAGISYSDPGEVEKRLVDIQRDLADRISRIDEVAEVPFNRMAHWGSDGRIKPDAPALSPFIRHKQNIELE